MATTQAFGATGGFGTFTGWGLQGGDNPAINFERANALDANGNEVASAVFNGISSYSANYTCNNNTNTPAGTIGKLEGSAVVTSITLSTSNKAAATMALAGHNHAVNAHTDTLLQAAHSLTVAKAFGAIDFLGGTGGDGASLVSGTVTISCQHTEVEDDDGEHVAGQNHGAMISATTVWSGAVTTPAAAGWDVTANVVATTNQGYKTTTITGTKKLALSAPA